MDFTRLKWHLAKAVEIYSVNNFDYFMSLYISEKDIHEEIDRGEGQIEVRVRQYFEDGQECWLDVFFHAYDDELEIGANIVFHKSGRVEMPSQVKLFKFCGLAKPIASLWD